MAAPRPGAPASLSWATALRHLPGSMLRLTGTYTPPIRTPNGIAELKAVPLNGHPQWLLVRGNDTSSPLLLYVPGGPGESNIWAAHYTMRRLEKHFVCVNWDPRGASKSLHPAPDPTTMSIDQLLSDTIALIEMLLARFQHEKLLLVGHSWGSLLAMKVAAARPDLLHAVVPMGLTVDNQRGEEESYRFVLERARAAHDRRAVRTLEQLGGSDTYTKSGKFVERMLLLRHGGLMHSTGLREVVALLLGATEFSILECLRYARNEGTAFSIPLMADELLEVNLFAEIKKLTVPVILFEGRHDHTASSSLAAEYFAGLTAPYKRLVWFENSGHPMDVEEPGKFQDEVIAIGAEFCRDQPAAAALS